jgi:hypothetical protein
MSIWTRRGVLAALAAASAQGLRAAANPLTLPAILNDFHQIGIPARIDGSPVLWCELDSGGGGALYFIDAEMAAAIGVHSERKGLSAGVAEGQPAADGRAQVTVDFPGLRLERQELVIKPTSLGKDGIVALANFARWVTEMDCETPAVRLHEAESFRYSGPGEAIPIAIEQSNPVVEAQLVLGPDGGAAGTSVDEIRGRFVVDTGAASSIVYLSRSFVERTRLADRNLQWVPDSMGLGAARIARFAVGPFGVDRPVIRRFGSRGFGGTPEPDGMIGVEFLRRFRLFFDYGRQRLILEPKAAYREPSRFDASGLRVFQEEPGKRGLKIFLVVPGTPAAEAGVREGDILLAVDHTAVDQITAGQVAEMLMEQGAERTLLIERGTEVVTARVKLRRLL